MVVRYLVVMHSIRHPVEGDHAINPKIITQQIRVTRSQQAAKAAVTMAQVAAVLVTSLTYMKAIITILIHFHVHLLLIQLFSRMPAISSSIRLI